MLNFLFYCLKTTNITINLFWIFWISDFFSWSFVLAKKKDTNKLLLVFIDETWKYLTNKQETVEKKKFKKSDNIINNLASYNQTKKKLLLILIIIINDRYFWPKLGKREPKREREMNYFRFNCWVTHICKIGHIGYWW